MTPPSPSPGFSVHRPVLLREALELLVVPRGGTVVECTTGTGGHTRALLEAVGPSGRVIGIDRDAESLEVAKQRLEAFGDCFEAVHADYRDFAHVLSRRGVEAVDGLLADLGFSSFQIDSPERGFSFAVDGPLDMRMDRSVGETASHLIATRSEAELAVILREYGEERAARRIARAMVRAREKAPIRSTLELARIVERAAGGRRGGRIHPATRTFQALRIEVNRELDGLDRFVEEACRWLSPGARAAFIAFHSLEDRVVKQALRALEPRCVCPPAAPRCECGRPGWIARVTGKAVRPGPEEIDANPRSRSARLRVVERRSEPAGAGSGERR